MDQDPIHKCFALMKSVAETEDASRIPDVQREIDRYLAIHTESQRIFALTQLDNQIAGLWDANTQGNRLVVLASISSYVEGWLKKLEKRNDS